jgi:hypothetical protein
MAHANLVYIRRLVCDYNLAVSHNLIDATHMQTIEDAIVAYNADLRKVVATDRDGYAMDVGQAAPLFFPSIFAAQMQLDPTTLQ